MTAQELADIKVQGIRLTSRIC